MEQAVIIANGRVLTMDPARPRAEAVGFAQGRIVAVGGLEEVRAACPGAREVDVGGRSVLPGFVESHLHLGLGGAELLHLQVGGLRGIEALRRAFHDFSTKNPASPLLMAQGGDYAMLPHAMTRADLDAVWPDRPIAITAADHHTVWANTAALRAAGLLRGAVCPPGHEVVMAPDGFATGELREFEAFGPVIALSGEGRLNLGIATGEEPAVPPSDAERAADRAAFARGLKHCAAHGVTSLVTMDGNRYTLELLEELRAKGALTARAKVPFHFKPHMGIEALERASAMARDFAGPDLSSGFVKMFMDGVVDSRTAFMLNDYPGVPGHRGAALFEAARFAEICAEADRRGLQIAVHAIGDGAVRRTLDGFAQARAANGPRDARHRIEHIELIDPSDVPRLAALGVTASLQPPHAPGAMDFPMEPTMTTLGWARAADAYLCRDLRDAGAAVAFASDWPVTDISVTRGIAAALTRPVYAGGSDQSLSLLEILQAYTVGGAQAAFWEGETGQLKPTLSADIVVLDGDVEGGAQTVASMGVALTIAQGRVTHSADGWG